MNPYRNSQVAAQSANVSLHSNPFSIVALTSAAVMLILGAPDLTVQVSLRHGQGVRHIRLYMAWISFVLLWTVFSLSGATWYSPTPARIFAVVMMAMAIIHSRLAWKRFLAAGSNPRLHRISTSDGIPYVRYVLPKINDRFLKIVIEPAIVATWAMVCFSIALALNGGRTIFLDSGWSLLGEWLIISAISHALSEYMLYEQRLHAYLDLIDENLAAAAMLSVTAELQESTKTVEQNPLGVPILYTPELFKVMESSRQLGERSTTNA